MNAVSYVSILFGFNFIVTEYSFILQDPRPFFFFPAPVPLLSLASFFLATTVSPSCTIWLTEQNQERKQKKSLSCVFITVHT